MLWIVCLALLGLLLYWELVIAEGVHLGPRMVVWLYDLVAPRYERIKRFDPATEDAILGLPLVAELLALRADAPPKVLDVAAGNGRVARALLRQAAFEGTVVCLDLSARMLAAGRRECAAWPERVSWLRSPDQPLPFAAGTFDAVTCLEALEFFPEARAALAECVRVLRPGGLLVVTNRVGRDARLLFGKTFTRAAFRSLLAEYPLDCLRLHPWQVDYDLGWARKKVCPCGSVGDEFGI